MKKVLTMLISVMLLLSVACPVMATSNIVKKDQGVGVGVGVSSQAPTTGTVQPNATTPPPSSAGTIILGSYDGDVTWATGLLYSDKWVRTSGTTIYIDAKFGQYATKEDAINRVNPYTVGVASIPVSLINSSGNIVQTINFKSDNVWRTGTFTVTANTDYYVRFNFAVSGSYHSGPFEVYK